MNQMLCGYRDDPRQWDEGNTMSHARNVEAYTDELLSDCRVLANAESINADNDLYDGDLLPKIMTVIANWSGNMLDSHHKMAELHNLLANALQQIAEREVKP